MMDTIQANQWQADSFRQASLYFVKREVDAMPETTREKWEDTFLRTVLEISAPAGTA